MIDVPAEVIVASASGDVFVIGHSVLEEIEGLVTVCSFAPGVLLDELEELAADPGETACGAALNGDASLGLLLALRGSGSGSLAALFALRCDGRCLLALALRGATGEFIVGVHEFRDTLLSVRTVLKGGERLRSRVRVVEREEFLSRGSFDIDADSFRWHCDRFHFLIFFFLRF